MSRGCFGLRMEKNDRMFLVMLAFFAILCMSRFYDHALYFHPASFPVLQSYSMVVLVTTAYYVVLFMFYAVCVGKVLGVNKKLMYYLVVFCSVFTFPMFLQANYFGTMDVYACFFTLMGVCLVILERGEWIVSLLGFVSACICPMFVFSGGCLLIVFLFYKGCKKEKKKYGCIGLLLGVAEAMGFLISYFRGSLSMDVQVTVSLRNFVLMVILMSPYLLMAVTCFKCFFRDVPRKMKIAYMMILVGGIPSVAMYALRGDFARTVFYVFAYYVVVLLTLMAMRDEKAEIGLLILKGEILRWVPIPAVVVVYPFLFMTLWISGAHELIVETVLGQ